MPSWRTHFADRIHLGTPAPPSCGEEYIKVRECLELSDACGRTLDKFEAKPKAKELYAVYSNSWSFAEWYRSALLKSFCLNKPGYMGLVPGKTQEGDFIVILLGGDLPFVLGPVSDDYTCLLEIAILADYGWRSAAQED